MIGGNPGDDFLDALDNVIRSIVRFHHWPPETIENMFLDDMDFFGLIYWYNDLISWEREIKSTK